MRDKYYNQINISHDVLEKSKEDINNELEQFIIETDTIFSRIVELLDEMDSKYIEEYKTNIDKLINVNNNVLIHVAQENSAGISIVDEAMKAADEAASEGIG